MKRTKIVATIGPNTANKYALKKMYTAGMTVARLNGSHNTLHWHKNVIRLIKDTLPDCPILLDIPGKKIRTAKLNVEPNFKVNDKIILTTEAGFTGEEKVSLTNKNLHKYISRGDIVFADDGTLKFIVERVIKRDIVVKAKTNGILKSSKGINVPHVKMGGALITERDKSMIKFALQNKVDFIGISFVESSKHIRKIRKIINRTTPLIVAKVENSRGLINLDEIVSATDVVMIDRGDLSTETNIETLPINQKKIIQKALEYSKPIIVATEMLDNMIKNPYPTKAEVLDISHSIQEGATATMLSGETAVGKFPVESIEVMSKIASASISNLNEDSKFKSQQPNYETAGMANAIKLLCESLSINKIVAITISGFAARIVSSQLLPQPIIAISNDKELCRTFNIFNNTKGIYYNTKFYKDKLEHIPKCLHYLWKNKYIRNNDKILVTALGFPNSGRRMNLIQTHHVEDLAKRLSWK